MKGAGLAAPYSVPICKKARSIRQTERLDPCDELQGVATFLAIAETIIEIFARGNHKAALALVFADRARVSVLIAASYEVQV